MAISGALLPGAAGRVRRDLFATRLILEVAADRGISVADCLAGTGFRASTLDDPEGGIEPDQELALVRNVVRRLGDPGGLGIEIGRRVNLGNLGMLGFAILSSPTVRDAATLALRYVALSPSYLTITLTEQDGRVVLLFETGDLPADLREFFLARDMTAVGAIVPLFVALVSDARVELALGSEYQQRLEGVLPVDTVEFGCPRTAVTFPAWILDQPLANADPNTARMFEQQCEELLQRRQIRTGTAELVRSRLLAEVGDPPTLAMVAKELNHNPRTVRRHLTSEGTSYSELLDEVRETLAVDLLSNIGLTVEEVARRLGYADTATFSHAFKRWRGVPPSSLRRRPGPGL